MAKKQPKGFEGPIIGSKPAEGETLGEIYKTQCFRVITETGNYYFPVGVDTVPSFLHQVKEHGGVWATPTHFVFLKNILEIKLWPKAE
jgi:hypothetical protein